MVYNRGHSFFSGDKECVLNVQEQYMNGIFTPDFLKESETTPECVEENDSEKNLSMENMCTPPAATKKRKKM